MFYDFDRLKDVLDGRWINSPRPGQSSPVGVATDTREPLAGRVFVALRGERFDGHDFLDQAAALGAAMLIVDASPPSMPRGVPVLSVKDTHACLLKMAHLYRREVLGDVAVIAITGSCGKTTTKSLVHAALGTTLQGMAAPRSFNNDIGVPLTLMAAQPHDNYVVVELGTNAPGEIARLAEITSPDIGVITMIGKAHLEGFGSLEAIRREKLSLLQHIRADGVAFVPASIDVVQHPLGCAVRRFGSEPHADIMLRTIESTAEGCHFTMGDDASFAIELPGEHNAMNTLPAIAIARQLGCCDDAIRMGLLNADVPAMRWQATEVGDVRFINDAYNANPQSMRASLATFADVVTDATRRICVLGDMGELGTHCGPEHGALLTWVMQTYQAHIDGVLLIGPAMREAAIEWTADEPWCIVAGDTCDEHTRVAVAEHLRPGDVVLVKGSRCMMLERVIESLEAATILQD